MSEEQADIADLYAGRLQGALDVAWQRSEDGLAPTLAGALATFRCRPGRSDDGGDHLLQLGVVVDADVNGDGRPLVFNRGRFTLVPA